MKCRERNPGLRLEPMPINEKPGRPARRIVVMPPGASFRGPEPEEAVMVWVLPLVAAASDSEGVYPDLTLEERARAGRYKVDSARRQFAASRALLRQVLGAHLGVAPLDVPIAFTGAGKPVLAGGELHFNVTHTDGLALIALAHQPVGIDVERVRSIADPEGLVRRFFSPHERETYLALPEALRPAGFFRGWTCKEALIKASGLSVAFLDEFDVELHPERPPALLSARHTIVAACPWVLAAWQPARDYVAAIALEGAGELRLSEA